MTVLINNLAAADQGVSADDIAAPHVMPESSKSALTFDPRPNLIGLNRDALGEALKAIGLPDKALRMRTSQLWHWLYIKGAKSFDEMTNISKDLRAQLGKAYQLTRPEIVEEQISVDGTRKWLLRFAPVREGDTTHEVEAVYIPDDDRGTLCVSSQVGCTLTCSFCHTGTQKMVRNLSSGEIVAQLLVARDRLGDYPDRAPATDGLVPSNGRLVSNVVMMGMGEPLYNTAQVKEAMKIMSDGDGLSLSRRRITLSTSGVVPDIAEIGADTGVMLAISLHAVHDDLRNELVPINKKYNIETLLDACRNYPGLSNAKRITFEYVMLKGVNDSVADAKQLVRLLARIPSKINLIPFNPWPGSRYECSDWEQIERFAEVVNRAGYASPIRMPRGRDIFAACGQLKSASEKLKAKDRMAKARAEADAALVARADGLA